MTEKTDVDSPGAALLDWDDRLQKYRGSSRSNGVAFYLPPKRVDATVEPQPDEDDNCQYLHCYVLLPKDGGMTFAANVIARSHVDEPWLGMVNRNALIVALEPQFFRVQIFGDELE
jgi:hypothetical protein